MIHMRKAPHLTACPCVMQSPCTIYSRGTLPCSRKILCFLQSTHNLERQYMCRVKAEIYCCPTGDQGRRGSLSEDLTALRAPKESKLRRRGSVAAVEDHQGAEGRSAHLAFSSPDSKDTTDLRQCSSARRKVKPKGTKDWKQQ
ncbi:uncharacterized protein WM277_019115 isoform 3-T3 [Molossus nigricans]